MFDELNYPAKTKLMKDRILWIYSIISLFFTILGVVYLKNSVQIVYWVLSNICLWLAIYDLSCSTTNKVVWIFLNLLYIAILVIGLVWCTEYNNSQAGLFRSISCILVLIGGITLIGIAQKLKYPLSQLSLCFWFLIYFNLLWLISCLYTIVPFTPPTNTTT